MRRCAGIKRCNSPFGHSTARLRQIKNSERRESAGRRLAVSEVARTGGYPQRVKMILILLLPRVAYRLRCCFLQTVGHSPMAHSLHGLNVLISDPEKSISLRVTSVI